MSIRIQLKRDLSHNWTLHNPILLNGEIGIETDTLKFKIGNGGRWNDQTSYAFKLGEANGVAMLNSSGKLAVSQLPDSFSISADIANALSLLTTTNLPEGTNKYFTNARALAKTEAVALASSDATTKANAAKIAAETTASADATSKANAAQVAAVASAGTAADLKIATYSASVNGAISSAISTEAIARNEAITAATQSLTTSGIAEGTNLYFTNARAVSALSSNLNTTNIPEGTNLYFTNARAVSALSSRTTQILQAALQADEDLRISINDRTDTELLKYVSLADKDVASGFAGLNASGLISIATIPNAIARKTDIDTAVAALVDSAPSTLNTLGELATALAADQSGITALNTSIGLKLSTTDAASTYATIINVDLKAPRANPTFTGTVTIPAGASISGYLATSVAASTYLTIANAASSYVTSTGLQNTLTTGGYLEEGDRNVASGFAGVNASGYILPSLIEDGAITNAKLTNSQITINGTAVSLGGNLSVTAGYSNSNTGIPTNVISYGTSATPPSGTAVGDIYIQY